MKKECYFHLKLVCFEWGVCACVIIATVAVGTYHLQAIAWTFSTIKLQYPSSRGGEGTLHIIISQFIEYDFSG